MSILTLLYLSVVFGITDHDSSGEASGIGSGEYSVVLVHIFPPWLLSDGINKK